jgi:hypothetical protein
MMASFFKCGSGTEGFITTNCSKYYPAVEQLLEDEV